VRRWRIERSVVLGRVGALVAVSLQVVLGVVQEGAAGVIRGGELVFEGGGCW